MGTTRAVLIRDGCAAGRCSRRIDHQQGLRAGESDHDATPRLWIRIHVSGELFQGELAEGEVLHVPLYLVELGVRKSLTEEPFELVVLRAVTHSVPSSTDARLL